MTRRIALSALAMTLAACRPKAQPRRYQMQGEIKDLNPATKNATVSAGQIGDWMGPMTMEYPFKPDAEFAKLHVGDHIEATVVVNDLKYFVTEVTVVPK